MTSFERTLASIIRNQIGILSFTGQSSHLQLNFIAKEHMQLNISKKNLFSQFSYRLFR